MFRFVTRIFCVKLNLSFRFSTHLNSQQNVNSKIGKLFLNLITTSFDVNQCYKKIFNRNTIKISYSCTSNFKNKIKVHNNKILNKNDTNDKFCNCRKEPCPLNNQCLISNIIYKATITTDKTTKQYLGYKINTINSVFFKYICIAQ